MNFASLFFVEVFLSLSQSFTVNIDGKERESHKISLIVLCFNIIQKWTENSLESQTLFGRLDSLKSHRNGSNFHNSLYFPVHEIMLALSHRNWWNFKSPSPPLIFYLSFIFSSDRTFILLQFLFSLLIQPVLYSVLLFLIGYDVLWNCDHLVSVRSRKITLDYL